MRVVGHAADRFDREVCLAQQPTRVCEQHGSRVGEHHRARRAAKQTSSELSFQFADLIAHRRLRDVQTLGGPTEVQFLGDSDEITKVTEFHSRGRSAQPRG